MNLQPGDLARSKYNHKCLCKVVEVTPYVVVMEVLVGSSVIGSRLTDDKTRWGSHWSKVVA